MWMETNNWPASSSATEWEIADEKRWFPSSNYLDIRLIKCWTIRGVRQATFVEQQSCATKLLNFVLYLTWAFEPFRRRWFLSRLDLTEYYFNWYRCEVRRVIKLWFHVYIQHQVLVTCPCVVDGSRWGRQVESCTTAAEVAATATTVWWTVGTYPAGRSGADIVICWAICHTAPVYYCWDCYTALCSELKRGELATER